jgi:hypothetical protein
MRLLRLVLWIAVPAGLLAALLLWYVSRPLLPADKVEAVSRHNDLGYDVVFQGDLPPAEYEALSKELCASRPTCFVKGWPHGIRLPKRASRLTDGANTFVFFRNGKTGIEESLWDCRAFPQMKPRCLG